MSVDATVSFNPNFTSLATRAYRLLTGESTSINGGAMDEDQATQALFAGNLMLKSWQTQGVNLFRRTQLQLSIAAGQGTPALPYTFSPNVISFMNARWVVNGSPGPGYYERPLGDYSYLDYMNLPNKYTSGQSGPSGWMFDRQTDASYLYLFPAPALGGQLNATVGRIAADIDSLASNVDLPQEWLECFVYNLADRLMDDDANADNQSGSQTYQRITARAQHLYKTVLDFDRPDSVTLKPFGNTGRHLRRR